MQPLTAAQALDHSQVDAVPAERLLDLIAVARHHRDPNARKARRKSGQNRRQEVLGDGRAGPQPQFAHGSVGAETHFVLHAAVVVGQPFGAGEQSFPGPGQFETAAAAHEKLYLILGFQLADVFADGGLRDEKPFGRPGEAERPGRRNEDFESEIVHNVPN